MYFDSECAFGFGTSLVVEALHQTDRLRFASALCFDPDLLQCVLVRGLYCELELPRCVPAGLPDSTAGVCFSDHWCDCVDNCGKLASYRVDGEDCWRCI